MSGFVIASGPRDPRMYDVDPEFRKALIDLSGLVAASASRRARFFHRTSIAAGGTLRVVDEPRMPPHAFFPPGRMFRVIARYSNSQGSDDVSPTVRGLTLRLLDPSGASLLDLTFNSGPCFFAASAEKFRRAFAGLQERADVLAEIPSMRSVIWSNIRTATSYPAYDFYSQVPQGFIAGDGTRWLIRFRVHPVGEPVRDGYFDHDNLWWPPDAPDEIERPAGDRREPTTLRDDLRARLVHGDVTSRLQAQLHPVTDSEEDLERAANPSVLWSETDYPWIDLAELRLDHRLDDDEIDKIAFDPALGPPELGILLARSPHSTASVNHLRALLYQMASLARSDEPMPAALTELLRPGDHTAITPRPSIPRRTVCVLGGGASGLTVARELERSGHRAIVLEAEQDVAGKCASITLAGKAYDLGGHICTNQYRRVAELAEELGITTVRTTPYRIVSATGVDPSLLDTSFFRYGGFQRYQQLRAREFPSIGEPGLAHSARQLAAPVRLWLEANGLQTMAATFGPGFAAAGYGYLDEDIPALYFVKYAEMTGLLSDDPPLLGHVGTFTVDGGFASFWQRVADDLRDVRCGVRVLSIDRSEAGVRVRTADEVIEADDLVVTIPPDQILSILDSSGEERELADMVRYNNYRTTMITTPALPQSAFHLLQAHIADSSTRGHCVAFHHRYADSDVHTCYSYGGPDVVDQVAEDLAALGGQPQRVHVQRNWSFMPHFGSEELRAGVLDRLEGVQGVRRTYYTGSLAAFELVECVVGYAQDLVRTHFPSIVRSGNITPSAHSEDRITTPRQARTHTAAVVRQWLISHIATELRASPSDIDPAAPLERYALESMTVAALQSGLSNYLGFRVPHTLFFQASTIEEVADHLVGADHSRPTRIAPSDGARHVVPTSARTPHLIPLTPIRPFFCAGGAGGTAAYLRPLAKALGNEQPFFALEMPGLDGSEEPAETIEDIAKIYVGEVLRVQPAGPYRIGGHSVGGIIAYEMGRQLRAAGHEVGPIVAMDTYMPLAGQAEPASDDLVAIDELLAKRHFFCEVANRCSCGVDPDKSLSEQPYAVARALGAKEPAHAEQHVANLLRVYQASLRALVAYTAPASDLVVHLLVTEQGFAPLPRDRHRIRLQLDAPANGWEHVKVGELTVTPLPGGHFTMFMPPHLAEVATAVRAALRVDTAVTRNTAGVRNGFKSVVG